MAKPTADDHANPEKVPADTDLSRFVWQPGDIVIVSRGEDGGAKSLVHELKELSNDTA